MTRSTHVALETPPSEKPILRISRRRAWILAFILATLFWLAVAGLAGLAIHTVQDAGDDTQTTASSQGQ